MQQWSGTVAISAARLNLLIDHHKIARPARSFYLVVDQNHPTRHTKPTQDLAVVSGGNV